MVNQQQHWHLDKYDLPIAVHDSGHVAQAVLLLMSYRESRHPLLWAVTVRQIVGTPDSADNNTMSRMHTCEGFSGLSETTPWPDMGHAGAARRFLQVSPPEKTVGEQRNVVDRYVLATHQTSRTWSVECLVEQVLRGLRELPGSIKENTCRPGEDASQTAKPLLNLAQLTALIHGWIAQWRPAASDTT